MSVFSVLTTRIKGRDSVLASDINALMANTQYLYDNLISSVTAWAAWSGNPTALSGTFTAATFAGRWRKEGNTIHFTVDITITTNGSAAQRVYVALPTGASKSHVACAGFRNDTTVVGGHECFIAAGDTRVAIFKSDGSYPGGDGVELIVSGEYELV